jgi:hypothetical protein
MWLAARSLGHYGQAARLAPEAPSHGCEWRAQLETNDAKTALRECRRCRRQPERRKRSSRSRTARLG